jgi:hypothetical protein
MQCEACIEPATVRVTEVCAGKPVERNYCKRHAAEAAGVVGRVFLFEWEPFIDWVVARFKEHGTLPAAVEVSQQGEIGARMATVWHAGDGLFEEVRHAVQKRVAGY